MESSVSWNGWYGRPHHRRVGHFHDFRHCLSLLRGEEPHRTDSAGGARGAHLLHNLSVVEQSHYPLRGKVARTRYARRIPGLVVTYNRSRRTLSLRHWSRMASPDLRTRTKDLHESLWNNLLLVGRSARFSRDRRPRHALHRSHVRVGRPCRP